MSKDNKYKAPRGTYDILPKDSYKWEWIISQFRKLAAAFNYREIVTPIFEQADLFERSVGDSSDIVEKEMYKFNDRKGRIFALRPEGTAPVVRSYIENNLQAEGKIIKLYYVGPMFRYDRPQKGRYRQFYQYGIEQIGSPNPYIDAEVILFADMFVRKLGLSKYRLEINSIGCPECSLTYDKALISFFEKHLDKLCPDCNNRIMKNPKRLLDCKINTCIEIAAEAPSMLEYLDEECREHFEKVKYYLTELNVKHVVNPRIVRGLDYYNRTAFELIDTNRNTQNALLGGGRYDGLISSLGGTDTPAMGFAGGFERLMASMENEKLFCGQPPKPDVYVIAVGDKAVIQAIKLCSQLREKGIVVDCDFEKSSFKKQLKAALKSDCRYAVIIGEDEIVNNTITLKDLRKEKQQRLHLNDLTDFPIDLLKE